MAGTKWLDQASIRQERDRLVIFATRVSFSKLFFRFSAIPRAHLDKDSNPVKMGADS
jgi:hypothetical protein